MIDKKIINKKIQPRDRKLEAVFFIAMCCNYSSVVTGEKGTEPKLTVAIANVMFEP
jgi:hypothetical protein